MKRFFCLLMACMFLPLTVIGEEIPAAQEIEATLTCQRTVLENSDLRDGLDDTSFALPRAKEATIAIEIPEGATCANIFLRLNALPAKVTARQLNAQRRYENLGTMDNPGAEFTLHMDREVTGKLELVLTFSRVVACEVTELRLFGEGPMPARVHAWNSGVADVLVIAEDAGAVDGELLATITEAGKTAAVLVMAEMQENPLPTLDLLWRSGVRHRLLQGGLRVLTEKETNDTIQKVWPDKLLSPVLVQAIREVQPMLIVVVADAIRDTWIKEQVTAAAEGAADYRVETTSAAAYGLAPVAPVVFPNALTEAMAEMNTDRETALLELCKAPFATAVYTDPATIPWPATMQENGFLSEGEFLYENENLGLWAYASPTVKVEIVRYEQPEFPRVWFVTNVKFDPEKESFGQRLYSAASFAGQQTYPETLAQNEKLILGINGDYYPYRVERKYPIGNIMRNRQVLYDYNSSKTRAYPNLDTMALHDDGRLTVHDGKQVTATGLSQDPGIHDILSFGPYLAKNGKLRIYAGDSWDAVEPRNAIGTRGAGDYVIVTVEGRNYKGPAGMNLNMLAQLVYAQGVTDAFNLDGGNTSVLIFMGKKLNRTGSGKKTGSGTASPRNMHELFGVGTSSLVHTDKLNGK